MKFYSKIKTAVGNNRVSNTADILNTRKNFKALGLHRYYIDKPYIDRELDEAIRTFQRELDLREGGLMNPAGETEKTLNLALKLQKADADNSIEREELAPPNIPGTNIPDEGIPEGGDPNGIGIGDPSSERYDMDHDIEIKPPFMDPEMEIFPSFPNSDVKQEKIASIISFLKRRR